MHYIVESEKTVDQAAEDLQTAVTNNKFGVLYVHDLRSTMESKGVAFPHECRIFEVCNPHQAKKVLEEDMVMNMALPCRISVWGEDGKTRIGMLLPTRLLETLSDSPSLRETAEEVEAITKRIIDESR